MCLKKDFPGEAEHVTLTYTSEVVKGQRHSQKVWETYRLGITRLV